MREILKTKNVAGSNPIKKFGKKRPRSLHFAQYPRKKIFIFFENKIIYDAWSIKNAFMGPIIFGDLRLLTNEYTITFVFKLQLVIC